MESLGSRLKNIRLQKGLSLEEAQKKTKIHINILKAIEEDNLVNISPVYLKGFLKIYCKFLDVNPAEFIPDYKEPQRFIKVPKQIQPQETSFIRNATINLGKLRKLKPAIKVKPLMLAVGVIVAVILFISFVKAISAKSGRLSSKQGVTTVVKTQNKAEVSKSQNAPSQTISKSKVAEEKPQSTIPSGIRLIIRAKEDCYVQLKTDGHLVFQSTLKKGRFEAWQAKEKIELSLGNAGAVDLEVNGKPISNLGRRKQAVKNILITKDGLKVP